MPYVVTSTDKIVKMPYKVNASKVMKTGAVWHHTDGEMKQHEENPKENHNSNKKTDTYA